MTLRRTVATAGAGLVLALAAVLGVAEAASAHDQLAGASPAAGETVTALTDVTLTFSSSLLGPDDQSANLVEVTGPDGLHYETACATVAGPVASVPVALGPAGSYTVTWRVVSSDGHPVSDAYAFTYAPEGGTDAAAGTATSSCAAIAAGDAGAAGGAGAAADDGTGAGLVAGLSTGAVVVGVLVFVVMTGLQGRKKKPRAED